MNKFVVIIFSLLLIGFTSCGKKETKTDSPKDTVKTEIKKDTNTTGDKKDDKAGNELGLKSGIPADFPKDVPQPPNSTCHGTIYNQTDGNAVTFISKAKPLEIVNFYKEELKKNGFTFEAGQDEMVNEKGGMLKWSKGKLDVEVMMSYKAEANESDVVLSYKEKK